MITHVLYTFSWPVFLRFSNTEIPVLKAGVCFVKPSMLFKGTEVGGWRNR